MSQEKYALNSILTKLLDKLTYRIYSIFFTLIACYSVTSELKTYMFIGNFLLKIVLAIRA